MAICGGGSGTGGGSRFRVFFILLAVFASGFYLGSLYGETLLGGQILKIEKETMKKVEASTSHESSSSSSAASGSSSSKAQQSSAAKKDSTSSGKKPSPSSKSKPVSSTKTTDNNSGTGAQAQASRPATRSPAATRTPKRTSSRTPSVTPTGTPKPPKPSPSQTPAAAPTRTAEPAGPPSRDRYLMPMQVLEGFGAYPDGVTEMFMLAKKTNRWLIEPCVRNACVEPCRCGQVVDDAVSMPPFNPSRAAAGEDPLGLPSLNARCKQYRFNWDNGFKPDQPEPAYPLRAYFDIEDLKERIWPYVISYNEWCTSYNATGGPDGGHAVRDEKFPSLWRADTVYSYDFDADPSGASKRPIGDFVFSKALPGRAGNPGKSPAQSLEMLMNDDSNIIFILNYYRHFLFGDTGATPKLNPWHEAAVDYWLTQKYGQEPYLVFQWRHEFAEKEIIPWCAETFYRWVNKAVPNVLVNKTDSDAGGHTSRAAILVDMPPPGQTGHFWVDNHQDQSGVRTETVKWFMDHGFSFYDADRPKIDSGILAIRDYLVAVKAHTYLALAGAHEDESIRKCSKPGSNYISRIVADRRRRGRDSFFISGKSQIPEKFLIPEVGKSTRESAPGAPLRRQLAGHNEKEEAPAGMVAEAGVHIELITNNNMMTADTTQVVSFVADDYLLEREKEGVVHWGD